MLDELRAERALAVGGQAENAQVVALEFLPQHLGQLEAAEAGHAVVGNQQVEVGLLLQDAQGLFAVGGLVDLVQVAAQHVADKVAGGVGVVGHQDLYRAIALQAVQQAEGVVVGVLAFLEHVIDHALEQHFLAALFIVGAGEDDARQLVVQHQVDNLAVRCVRQVEVDDRGEKQLCRGFQQHLGLVQGGAEQRLQVRLLAEHLLQNLQHHRAVFDDENVAHN